MALTTYTVTPTLQVWSGLTASKINAYGTLFGGQMQMSKMNAYAALFPNATMWVSKVNVYAALFPNATMWVSKVNAYAVLFPGAPPSSQARVMVLA